MSRRRLGLRKRLALNIFSELYASTVREHRLDTLFWECTLRCNLSCRHCGSDCRVDPGVPDMPLEDFLKVLDEEITPHVDPSEVLIIFSGGEVLVRDDLERAGAEVTRRGYAWGMVTNGMALTEARLRSLLDAGLRYNPIKRLDVRRLFDQSPNCSNGLACSNSRLVCFNIFSSSSFSQ